MIMLISKEVPFLEIKILQFALLGDQIHPFSFLELLLHNSFPIEMGISFWARGW